MAGGGGSGVAVEFFHEADPNDLAAKYVWQEGFPPNGSSGGGRGPRLLKSHGWLEGSLQGYDSLEAAAAAFSHGDPERWPRVVPRQDLLFVDRQGSGEPPRPLASVRVPLDRLRAAPGGGGGQRQPPGLSLLLVRWGGRNRVGESYSAEEDESDGGWGKYGSPPCDWYMSALVREGLLAHPAVGAAAGRNFEVLSLFVGTSPEMSAVAKLAPAIEAKLAGAKKASFWMLWPAEWEDFGTADYAGYVEKEAFFAAMRACESAGIRSTFPHPAAQYELITSKSWMVTLSGRPEAALPTAVFVDRAAVVADPPGAARAALAALGAARAASPFPPDGSRPAPSVVNKDGIRKGVVKVGFSWEARFVLHFSGEKQLAARLQDMLICDGCLATRCMVQEWVDFDFEIRLFFLPPADWVPGQAIRPVRFEYNGWGRAEEGRPGSFTKLTRQACLKAWQQDEAALDAAQERAVELSQSLLSWLHAAHPAQPVAMIRLDFMLLRLGPGQARVVFGEFCEMGACCISWEEGPPTIWRAALDYGLR